MLPVLKGLNMVFIFLFNPSIFIHTSTDYYQEGNISSIFSSNSETNALELLKNLGEKFLRSDMHTDIISISGSLTTKH